MSYKNDMEFFKEQQKKRRTGMAWIIKITVLVLAVAILATGVTVGVTLLLGNKNPQTEENDGGDEGGKTNSGRLEITGPKDNTIMVVLGDKLAYKSFVTVNDVNAKLTVDNSKVDTSTPGSYPVYYTATDDTGAQAKYTLTLVISDGSEQYTMDRLMNMVALKAEELGITKTMTKVEQVRRIYNFVKDPSVGANEANIYFNDESNAPSQNAQSGMIRTGWENDWIEEAILTLSMNRMKGDCYTYYAVSKAFFEYFGIENIGIQRSANSGQAGTHFWHVVNVGSETEPKWYYYDATRLAGSFETDKTSNSCLITEEKLMSYKTSKGETGFYTFNKSQYKNFPTVETTPLTEARKIFQ